MPASTRVPTRPSNRSDARQPRRPRTISTTRWTRSPATPTTAASTPHAQRRHQRRRARPAALSASAPPSARRSRPPAIAVPPAARRGQHAVSVSGAASRNALLKRRTDRAVQRAAQPQPQRAAATPASSAQRHAAAMRSRAASTSSSSAPPSTRAARLRAVVASSATSIADRSVDRRRRASPTAAPAATSTASRRHACRPRRPDADRQRLRHRHRAISSATGTSRWPARYDRTTVRNRDAHRVPAAVRRSLDGDHRFARLNPALGITLQPARRRSTSTPATAKAAARRRRSSSAAPIPAQPCKLPNAMAGDPPLRPGRRRARSKPGVRGGPEPRLAWNAGVFRADNRDDILFVAATQSGFGYFKNFGKTRRQGIELGASARVGALGVGARLTLLDATLRKQRDASNGAGNSSNDARPAGSPARSRSRRAIACRWSRARCSRRRSTSPIERAGVARRRPRRDRRARSRAATRTTGTAADGVYYLGPGPHRRATRSSISAPPCSPRRALTLFAQINNVLDRRYSTRRAARRRPASTPPGDFVAQPFPADAQRPLAAAQLDLLRAGRAAPFLARAALCVRLIPSRRRTPRRRGEARRRSRERYSSRPCTCGSSA